MEALARELHDTIDSFNVAASIKMRKFKGETGFQLADLLYLQCGRIYKDAEILPAPFAQPMRCSLQCGRIYKDAEMWRRDA